LNVFGCGYWARLYEDLFKNRFVIDENELIRRLNAPNVVKNQGAAAVGQYLENTYHTVKRSNQANRMNQTPKEIFEETTTVLAKAIAASTPTKPPKPAPESKAERTEIFISYCHKDTALLDELKVFLKLLVRNDVLEYWDDSKIPTGAKWKDEIQKALNKAKVALFLVSPDFLASDFVMRKEIPPLLKAAETEGTHIVWIPLSHSLVKQTSIADYQAAGGCDPARPLDMMEKPERNGVFTKICEDIMSIMKNEESVVPPPHFTSSPLISHSDSTASNRQT